MLLVDNHSAWSVASAKNKLSEVIEKAQTAPQIITCHGKPSAVIVSIDEWTRKVSRKTTLVEFLKHSPLADEELNLERLQDKPVDELF